MGRDGGSPRVARAIVCLVPVGFFVASVGATAANRDGFGHLVAATAVLAVTLGLHLLHSTRAAVRRRKPWWPWSLVAHGVVTYVPYLFFQDTWVGIPGSFAAAVLLTTPVPPAWVAFAVLSALQVPLVAALGETTWQGLNAAVSHVVGGLALFGVVRLADLAQELQSARTELARQAVDRERLRFARDLHDLCGYSLTAVALQSEQIRWLVRSDPQRAEEELARTQALARHALSEVRAVSAGYRVLSLEREARAAAGLLESLGVIADVELSGRALPGPVDETLAIVVREGVTNALRHSKARHCAIRLTVDGARDDGVWARLEVSNDGVAPGEEPTGSGLVEGPGGSGLRNLRERVAERGGVLTAEADGGSGFRLAVALPCPSRDTVPGGASGRV
ncbi:sensor histidine kinase [Streptomyces luteogriseus]|uniref:Two-component system sensor histidine kinase DesK n=1 Tax=Streptomyces luteogriseus TaxID=68233 RepID=A0A7W7DSA4_9ACTN|nr:sensor histidine kinase [Streptomyces luteogriseus]MBB4715125.1 two-component system sensor histidine kinase DesK [Streptomyces luteogriseus]